MQSVVEFEQEKVNMQKNLDERQLNKSRYIVAPPFKSEKYMYIVIIYIFKKKKRRKIGSEASPTGRT